jgi:hypothetical protein
MQVLLDNHKYFLEDNVHFFIVRNDEYDDTVKRVLFYKEKIYIANERLMGRSLETLLSEFEQRKIPR